MDSLRYAARELAFRRGRSLVTAVSIALAVLAAVLLTTLAGAYSNALRVPLETVGADVIVQRQGDIPPKLEGLVFPHPNALIPAGVIEQIKTLPGVISLTRAVYMWDLEPNRYESILGIEDSDVGLKALAERLVTGKPIKPDSRAVLVDSDFATKNHLRVGDSLPIGPRDALPIAGIVDAAQTGKLIRADVYTPLAVAQTLAAAAPEVKALYPFTRTDANLVLVTAQRERLDRVVREISGLVGKNAVIESELSMRQALSGVLFVSQSMALIIATIIGLFAAAFVWRATASSIAERRREMAVLQAIGWSWEHIREQVLVENLALAIAGALLGIACTLLIAASLGHVSVTFDLPWDFSSTPHFIPSAALNRTQTIAEPISVSWVSTGVAIFGSIFISALAAISVLARPQARPWSLLHGE